MSYDIQSVFWDDDIPMTNPEVNYNNTPGSSTVWTSTTEYPGPSGQSGHHKLSGRWISGTGYDPCSSSYSSNPDYGIKAKGVYNTEYSPNYVLTLVAGDCLPGIVHFSSAYPTNGPWTAVYSGAQVEANIDRWEASPSALSLSGAGGYFDFTVQYNTTDGRYYDISITNPGSTTGCPQAAGYPSSASNSISNRVNMNGISSGSFAYCNIGVSDAVGGGSRTFTYRIYKP